MGNSRCHGYRRPGLSGLPWRPELGPLTRVGVAWGWRGRGKEEGVASRSTFYLHIHWEEDGSWSGCHGDEWREQNAPLPRGGGDSLGGAWPDEGAGLASQRSIQMVASLLREGRG